MQTYQAQLDQVLHIHSNTHAAHQKEVAALDSRLQAVTAQLAQQQVGQTTLGIPASSLREELPSILNPNIVEKLPSFSGRDEDFATFRFKFEGLCQLIGLKEEMDSCQDMPEAALTLADIDEEPRKKVKALWYLLVTGASGKCIQFLKGISDNNGLLAWK